MDGRRRKVNASHRCWFFVSFCLSDLTLFLMDFHESQKLQESCLLRAVSQWDRLNATEDAGGQHHLNDAR